MTIQEFKKIARLLKEVYAELEKEAKGDGIDISSLEYLQVRDAVRLEVLKRQGFTLEEYREAKALVAPARKVDVEAKLQEMTAKTGAVEQSVSELEVPSKEEFLAEAKIIAEQVVKPPIIKTEVIKETIVEKPTIVKETVTNTINEEFDANPLYAEIGYLNDRIENIKIPELPDFDEKMEKLEEQLKNDFMRELKHNIDMLGMPDFRKLAMGLQTQIDEIRNAPTATSSGTRTTIVTSGDTTGGSGGDFVYIVPGSHTITLPTAVGNTGMYTVKNNHSANITIGSLGGTIDGTATISLAPEESVTLFSDDTNWNIV